MNKPMLAGNWKMFKTVAEAEAFAAAFKTAVADVTDRDILICPPAIHLDRLGQIFAGTNVSLGGQNLYWEDQGAFTGEISGPMLKSTGATFALIGHSERRQYFGETDATVNQRTNAALKHGLVPVVCVGETLAQREAGQTMSLIETQVRGGLDGIEAEVLVAYEPVWAIGTGKTATPAMAQEVHAGIRRVLADMRGHDYAAKTRILYGGSVKPDNIDELMREPDIDGVLVGGASLDVESFARIVKFKA